jgi:hypothetical protein
MQFSWSLCPKGIESDWMCRAESLQSRTFLTVFSYPTNMEFDSTDDVSLALAAHTFRHNLEAAINGSNNDFDNFPPPTLNNSHANQAKLYDCMNRVSRDDYLPWLEVSVAYRWTSLLSASGNTNKLMSTDEYKEALTLLFLRRIGLPTGELMKRRSKIIYAFWHTAYLCPYSTYSDSTFKHMFAAFKSLVLTGTRYFEEDLHFATASRQNPITVDVATSSDDQVCTAPNEFPDSAFENSDEDVLSSSQLSTASSQHDSSALTDEVASQHSTILSPENIPPTTYQQ